MPEANIHAEAIITEQLRDVLYRASLPNGKLIHAHLSKALSRSEVAFQIGQKVIVELTPFSFDSGRILREA